MTLGALSPSTVIAGRYRIVREIGRGGMGVVYLVEHVHTGDHFALKALHAEEAKLPVVVDRFKREARASVRIRSEHVVKVIDADTAPELDGAPFLVMELLTGYGLDVLCKARGKLAPGDVVAVLTQVAVALDKAHAIGIVHRDIKPENIFLHEREDGSAIVKLLDFGISKVLAAEGASEKVHSTTTGVVMGTPHYMSPEQARGLPSMIGPGTDVWAIGIMALRMLSGEGYWRVSTMGDLMAHIIALPLEAPTERWPGLPEELDAWFSHACERDPRRRFGSVGEEVRELAAAMGVTSVPPLAIDPALVVVRRPTSSVRPAPSSVAPASDPSSAVPTAKLAAPVAGRTPIESVRSATGARPPRRRSLRGLSWIAAGATALGLAGVVAWRAVDASSRPATASTTPPVAASAGLAPDTSVTPPPSSAASSSPAPSSTASPATTPRPVPAQPAPQASTSPRASASAAASARRPKDSLESSGF